MKQALSSILTLAALIPLGCDPSPEPNLDDRALDEATPAAAGRGTITDPGLARHAFSMDAAGGYVGANSDTVRVDAEGLAVRLGQDTLRFTLQSWGRSAQLAVEPARPRLGACVAGAQTADTDCARRVEQSHGSLTAWVARRERAVEQGWTLSERPEGAGPVELRLAVTGGEIVGVEDDAAVLATRGVKWRYSGLKAWDADGKDLPAHLERSPRGLAVVVDDEGARYPVEIDPSIVATEVKLTPLDPQGNVWSEKYNYGAAIRDIGDLNGDGYDDVAVGAPHDVSILAPSNGCRGAGRVYLYFGTPLGIDPQSEQILDPIADGSYANWNAYSSFPAGSGCPMTRFGADIAAGDVDMNGKPELYIGAPGAMFDVNGSPNQDVGRVWNYSGFAMMFGGTPGVPMFIDPNECSAYEKIGTSVDVKNQEKGVLGVVASPASWSQSVQPFGLLYEGWLTEHCSASAWAGNPEYERFGHRARIIGTKGMKVAIAAPLHGDESEGRVHVSGLNAAPPFNGTNISLYNPDPIAGGRFGWDIDDAGDVNGDGHADLIVGAPGNKGSGETSGLAYLYMSKSSTPYFYDDDVQTVLPGEVKPHDEFGAVAGVGDLNGDGFDDLLFGAPGADNGVLESGRAYVVFGGADGADVANAVPLSPSEVKPYDFFGHRVSAAGDVDANGRPDLMVSACDKYEEALDDDNNTFGWCSGAVYVFNSP